MKLNPFRSYREGKASGVAMGDLLAQKLLENQPQEVKDEYERQMGRAPKPKGDPRGSRFVDSEGWGRKPENIKDKFAEFEAKKRDRAAPQAAPRDERSGRE
jgi:hypothetical protein